MQLSTCGKNLPPVGYRAIFKTGLMPVGIQTPERNKFTNLVPSVAYPNGLQLYKKGSQANSNRVYKFCAMAAE